MIALNFDKEFAERVGRWLETGGSIVPPNGNWTGQAMLAAAGVCLAGAMSQGPKAWGSATVATHHEHREAQEKRFFESMEGAVAFVAHLAFLIRDGQFDQAFEPNLKAVISQEGEVIRHVRPVSGFRQLAT